MVGGLEHQFYFPINIKGLCHHPNWRSHIFHQFYFPINIGFMSSSQLTNSYFSSILFSHILGMSSSQLTNSYFSEGFFPNHQPDMGLNRFHPNLSYWHGHFDSRTRRRDALYFPKSLLAEGAWTEGPVEDSLYNAMDDYNEYSLYRG